MPSLRRYLRAVSLKFASSYITHHISDMVLENGLMKEPRFWHIAWRLLDARERRNALLVLLIIIASAISSAVMVGSIMPFLAALARPEYIHNNNVLSYFYDEFGFETDYQFLIALGIASLAVIFVATAVQVLRTWAVTRFSTMRIHTLSSRLLSAYLRQPYEFFLQTHSTSLSTVILSESQQVVNQFLRPIADMIASVLTILAIVALLVWVNPVVAVIAFSALGTLYFATFAITRRQLSSLGKVRLLTNRERFRITNEALGGVKAIKLAGKEAAYLSRFDESSRQFARALAIVGTLSEAPNYILQAVAFGGAIVFCLALVSAEGLQHGNALDSLIPTLGLFAFAAQRIMPELGKAYRGFTQVQNAGPSVLAIHADLALETSADSLACECAKPVRLSRELRLENIAYTYPAAAARGLDNVSLTIRAGEKLGVVGSTGAGKSTLADVILGLLGPQSGTFVVDGTPVAGDSVRAWQRSVGYVPQDIFLSDSTIAENIAFGVARERIDMERVRKAAGIAKIDTFIEHELPNAYQTLIGERGVRLSGGQRQRLGIARALYEDADLILLDEATSALDNLTEREVMAAVNNLPGEKTLILIAHRLTTLRACDRIVLLKRGRISRVGTWAELIESSAEFQAMAQMVIVRSDDQPH